MSLTEPFRRVLCATDFSASASAALDWADGLARREGAELHLVHAWEVPTIASADAMSAAWTEALSSQVESDADRLLREATRGRKVTRSHVHRGRPDTEIVACATAIGADLVVLGTHGRTGFSHVIMGSVAERVVRTASVPVVTVPGVWAERAARSPPVRRVLVPTDVDAGAIGRVHDILAFARRLGAEVELVRVLELTPYLLRYDTIRRDVERSAHRDLAALAERLGAGPPPVRTHVRIGQPGDTIVALAAELDVDLVALPTHGRTGVPRFFLGSVAERVARTAGRPVLTVRPEGAA